MYTHSRKEGCRASLDYTYKGLRVAFLENDLLRVGILLDKGADVFEFTYKPRDLDFLWQSPIPMQKPFVATSALPEGAFHDYYYGGWQEVLPSAGWASEPYLGTFQGLHGEVSLLPFEASLVEDDPQRVSLRTRVRMYRSPLALERTLTLERGKAALLVHEKLVNESGSEFAIMWGHHPALGAPFLDETCVVRAPAGKVEVHPFHPNGLWQPGGDYDFPNVPNRHTGALEDITRVRSRETKSVDVVFFKELQEGWYTVTNTGKGVGFGMAWDASLFRYLWMWQVYGGHDDYPWYGRTYNIALEPFTSYPPAGIHNAIRNGSALVLQPGQVIETDLAAVAFEQDGISRVRRDGMLET
ncbi:MAG: aldose 1-epimerase [Anaerolineaceae bacterium]|nr:aldose 1-epimerase [Anaerolineaceae bacterium]